MKENLILFNTEISLNHYRGCLRNEVFLTQSEAEAKLKKLRGGKNGK